MNEYISVPFSSVYIDYIVVEDNSYPWYNLVFSFVSYAYNGYATWFIMSHLNFLGIRENTSK